MIINNTFKFIFIHIPKSAGTSITSFLSKLTNWCDLEIGGTFFGEKIQPFYRERFGLSKHAPASLVRKILGQTEWSKFFVFTFVRNPFSRIYSIYNFSKKWPKLPEKYKNIFSNFDTFEDFIMSDILANEPGYDNIFLPQVFWITDPPNFRNVNNILDYIGKVENLKSDLINILQIIDQNKLIRDLDELPHLNKSNNFDISIYENPKVVDKVRKLYKIDFEIFGYSMDVDNLINKEQTEE